MKAALLLLVAVVTVASPALAIDFPTGYPQVEWGGFVYNKPATDEFICDFAAGSSWTSPGVRTGADGGMYLRAIINDTGVVSAATLYCGVDQVWWSGTEQFRAPLYQFTSTNLLSFDPLTLRFVFESPTGPFGFDIDDSKLFWGNWEGPLDQQGYIHWIPGDFSKPVSDLVGQTVTSYAPEPGAMVMLLVGGVGLLRRRG